MELAARIPVIGPLCAALVAVGIWTGAVAFDDWAKTQDIEARDAQERLSELEVEIWMLDRAPTYRNLCRWSIPEECKRNALAKGCM